jgi:predicted dienelactone hydrolase
MPPLHPFLETNMSVVHSLLSARPRLAGAALAALLAGALSALAQVGQTSFPVADLPVTLTYPTAAGTRPVTMGPFTIDVAMNAPVRPGRHPLVVISHGNGGSAIADFALASAFAKAGFVVAQPLHTGDNYRDTTKAGPDAWRTRPAEMTRVIDALARSPQWSGAVDTTRVGVHGMSAGGGTALVMAGAQWSTLNLVRHCNQFVDDDPAFCFNGAMQPAQRAERQANFDRAKNVPAMFLPAGVKALHGGRTPSADQPDPRPDPRVASVTLAVPVAAIFTPESLARIRIPVGVVSARDDLVLLPRFHSAYVLQNCKACRSLMELPGAGHFDVLWPWPPEIAREVAATQVRGGLPQPGFNPADREQAQSRIVAFHTATLKP